MSDKKDNEKGSFWTTIPGCITATATLITALGGLLAVLYGSGFLAPKPTVTPVPPVVSSPIPPTLEVPIVLQPPSAPETTSIPSTDTSVPPTFTPLPPTSTFIPPTATFQRNTSIYVEAENGKLDNGAYVQNDSTASKNSYVNFSSEGTLKFTLGNMKAGQYSLVIHYLKYANGTQYPNTGFQNLYVNNDPDPISIYYTKTFGDGDPVTWNDTSLTISLEDGTNTLLISVIPGSIGASVDYIYLKIID